MTGKRKEPEIGSVLDYVVEALKKGLFGVATQRFHRTENQVVFYVPRMRCLTEKHINLILNTECDFCVRGADDKLKIVVHHRNAREAKREPPTMPTPDVFVKAVANTELVERWKPVLESMSASRLTITKPVINNKTIAFIAMSMDAHQIREIKQHLKEIRMRVSEKGREGGQGVQLTAELI